MSESYVIPAGVSYRIEKLFFDYTSKRGAMTGPSYLLTLLSAVSFRVSLSGRRHSLDMIHELFPAELDPQGRHAEEKRRGSWPRSMILHFRDTRNDLLERYPVAPEKVRVTHLARRSMRFGQRTGAGPNQTLFPLRRLALPLQKFQRSACGFRSCALSAPGAGTLRGRRPFSKTEKN